MQALDPSGEESGYQEIDHVADRAYLIWGPDLEALLLSGARALYDLAEVTPSRGEEMERRIEVRGIDRESLLVAWLNQLLFILEKDRITFTRFEFSELNDQHLRARGQGTASLRTPHDIKAATYHGLTVRSIGRRLEARVVFDV